MIYNATTETERFRDIAREAEKLDKALGTLAPTYRDHLQMATVESGGARGDAIRALLNLAQRLNDFAHGSVALDETMAYGIGTEGGPLDNGR